MRNLLRLFIVSLITMGALQTAHATPNYAQMSQDIARIANDSVRTQQQQIDINQSQTPFAPLHKLMKQGINLQTGAISTPPVTPTVPIMQPIQQAAPRRQTVRPKAVSKPAAPAAGISGLPEDNQQNDNHGVQFNF